MEGQEEMKRVFVYSTYYNKTNIYSINCVCVKKNAAALNTVGLLVHERFGDSYSSPLCRSGAVFSTAPPCRLARDLLCNRLITKSWSWAGAFSQDK